MAEEDMAGDLPVGPVVSDDIVGPSVEVSKKEEEDLLAELNG